MIEMEGERAFRWSALLVGNTENKIRWKVSLSDAVSQSVLLTFFVLSCTLFSPILSLSFFISLMGSRR